MKVSTTKAATKTIKILIELLKLQIVDNPVDYISYYEVRY